MRCSLPSRVSTAVEIESGPGHHEGDGEGGDGQGAERRLGGCADAVDDGEPVDAFGHAPDEKFGDEDGAQADR